MAFEPLAPPVLPTGIRKPTPAEIAEVTAQMPTSAVPVMIAGGEAFDASVLEAWPAGSHCACKRNKKGKPCGHIWKTRIAGKPTACPGCKQARWDQEPHQRKRKSK